MLLIVFQSVILRYPWSVSQLYSVSLVFSKALKKRFFAMLYKSKLEKKPRMINMFAVGLIRAGPFCIECTDAPEIRECLRTTIQCADNEVNRLRKYIIFYQTIIIH